MTNAFNTMKPQERMQHAQEKRSRLLEFITEKGVPTSKNPDAIRSIVRPSNFVLTDEDAL